ncbi:MAG TPA: hypothetical protein VHD85_06005 [Terracidiphilus sp.]|nr:hypothetical protein [Terracidiphilus sp.]
MFLTTIDRHPACVQINASELNANFPQARQIDARARLEKASQPNPQDDSMCRTSKEKPQQPFTASTGPHA